MSAGMWFLVWVGGLAMLGSTKGAVSAVMGAWLGLMIWLSLAFIFAVVSALNTEPCVEYGYPSLADMDQGKRCSDSQIREHIERTK